MINLSPNHPQALREFIENFEPAPYANLDQEAVAKIKKQISTYEKKSKEYGDKAVAARAVMKTMCPHTNKVLDSKYRAGDYYSKACTDYTVKCADCGDVLFTTNESHSYYG